MDYVEIGVQRRGSGRREGGRSTQEGVHRDADHVASSRGESDDTGLDALDYQFQDSGSDDDHVGGNAEATLGADSVPDLLFPVTNAAGTVTVTALLNGCVHRVDLSPQLSAMTEAEVAAEVLAVANVAATKARSGQYELVSGLLRIQGQDPDSIRELVEQQMNLPTPDDAVAAEASLATRHLRPN
ncbi:MULTISPECIES: hypothetical protein [unclassified Mycolicibacterium]|uniref:hypothetical protein n=1 Tax=unclassified Mycolicibacterium TaxID=2636767 RepID=UPI0012DBF6CF|nr:MULTISPECIES: hypothetical protein [unclassified Mycolicibacterium]MUL81994.1 hypothetical protein [Mycolicibacterium sp. CBMA 329]MUL87760.1 hypothetical protein [Mycolicibacterium sp. CBMA 331]MUM01584.1 hypothetical protein [Mycolicibacterium sp. CBMA 334]MUM27293.1 hypothetical protein [Mycolicibacterium sp. CBMA 295]MUM38057.1 hypothetical protein [Mycolicibacterium sp. CBMA 247]